MIEIRPLADVLLREAGYQTWFLNSSTFSTLCFEDDAAMGFLFVFDTVEQLLREYLSRENDLLAFNATNLRRAGAKAWNVYSIFLTAEGGPAQVQRSVSKIDEGLKRTRKISRCAVDSEGALRNALYPLLPIYSHPQLKDADYKARLERRVGALVGPKVATAFFSDVSDVTAPEVARIIVDEA